MFAKIFTQIFDSSIADDWQTRVVFQDMLVLADAKGVVDMTREAIARRTGLPMAMIQHAIPRLESPDSSSRTEDSEGRRIIRLDEHRDWGWQIVNAMKYRQSADKDMLRMAEADRKRAYRARFGKSPSLTLPTPKDLEEEGEQSMDMSGTVRDARGLSGTNSEQSQARPKKVAALPIVFPDGLNTEAFSAAWSSWLEHLRQKRKPPTAHSQELQLKKLAGMGERTAIATINHCIEHNWQGIFELPNQITDPKQRGTFLI